MIPVPLEPCVLCGRAKTYILGEWMCLACEPQDLGHPDKMRVPLHLTAEDEEALARLLGRQR